MSLKQVIIIRKDLKMRRGKEIAQGCHSSLAFICEQLRNTTKTENNQYIITLTENQLQWMQDLYKKICLTVNNEEELLSLHEQAKNKNIESHLILDSGKTEFNNVPTYTALALGPDLDEKIDEITINLKLY